MKSMVGQNVLSQEKIRNFEVSETTLTNYDDSAVPISSKRAGGCSEEAVYFPRLKISMTLTGLAARNSKSSSIPKRTRLPER